MGRKSYGVNLLECGFWKPDKTFTEANEGDEGFAPGFGMVWVSALQAWGRVMTIVPGLALRVSPWAIT